MGASGINKTTSQQLGSAYLASHPPTAPSPNTLSLLLTLTQTALEHLVP